VRTISRFESDLLRILHCLLGHSPQEEALPLLVESRPRPSCLSRDAVELVQSTLATGCVRFVARGSWRRERFLRDGDVVEGRLWERTGPGQLGLAFSENSLDLLIWLTAVDASAAKRRWSPRRNSPMTLGDRFLLFLAYRALRGTGVGNRLGRWPVLASHGLCRLAFPDEFADLPDDGPLDDGPLDLETWTTGVGACLVEALEHELAHHWVRIERSKARITAPDAMCALGTAQERVLGQFLDALEEHERRDLARFLLVAASRILRHSPPAEAWTGRLEVSGLAMRDRAEVYRHALAFLRALERLARWQSQARTVGYFDEGYAASQLWKSDWERLGGTTCSSAARAIARRVGPMRSGGPEDRPPEAAGP
jgi:hypothetical protein